MGAAAPCFSAAGMGELKEYSSTRISNNAASVRVVRQFAQMMKTSAFQMGRGIQKKIDFSGILRPECPNQCPCHLPGRCELGKFHNNLFCVRRRRATVVQRLDPIQTCSPHRMQAVGQYDRVLCGVRLSTDGLPNLTDSRQTEQELCRCPKWRVRLRF